MSKTCPNCGVNSPDNAKFCIECAHSLEGVPINKEEKPVEKNEDEGSPVVGCILMIIIAAIVIVAVGFLFLGWGGDNGADENITITFDEVYSHDFTSTDGKTYYDYFVKGYFDKMPKDVDKYMVKTKYCDSSGKELVSTSKRMADFENDVDKNYASSISFYQTQNYLDVDHICVQIVKDNTVVQEFNTTMNNNRLSSHQNSGNSSK